MKQYKELLELVLSEGKQKGDRTGTGTLSVFGAQAKFDLSKGFPLLTTKKLHLKSIIHELLWIISSDTNIKYLQDNGVKIWDKWSDKNGDLGPVYGEQWRSWRDQHGNSIDQLTEVIERIKSVPNSRRLIVTAWNPGEVDKMALPPCHCFFQFYVNEGKLDCQLYQRSCDLFLGNAYNIASYSLLTMMVAQVCGLEAGVFTHTYGDLHLYNNHIEQAKLQLTREPRPLPKMTITPRERIDGFKFEDFKLEGYDPHPHIKAEVSV